MGGMAPLNPSSFHKKIGPGFAKGPSFEAWKWPKMGWLFFQGSFPSTALQGWTFEAPHDVQDEEACCKMVLQSYSGALFLPGQDCVSLLTNPCPLLGLGWAGLHLPAALSCCLLAKFDMSSLSSALGPAILFCSSGSVLGKWCLCDLSPCFCASHRHRISS